MGPLYSIRIPRVRIYSGYCRLRSCFTYETLTLSCQASHPVRLHLLLPSSVLTLKILLLLVWPLSLSLATTREISVDFFSSAYLDVSVRQGPHVYLLIQYTFSELYLRGVAPFGYLRIKAYLQLPVAFRSLSRPSSAPGAKAFSLRSF